MKINLKMPLNVNVEKLGINLSWQLVTYSGLSFHFFSYLHLISFVFTSFIFMFVTFISNLNFIMLCREGDPKVLKTLIDSQCSFR